MNNINKDAVWGRRTGGGAWGGGRKGKGLKKKKNKQVVTSLRDHCKLHALQTCFNKNK